MRIAVAGGTGLVGARVVAALKVRGDDVVVLARASGVDLVSGEGLAEALVGVDAVIDVTSTTSRAPEECVAFFGAVATNLQRVGAEAGVGRIITLSIVGIDGLGGPALGHYEGKAAQEAATLAGSVPTVILRATQFHDFPGQLIAWTAVEGSINVSEQPVQTVELDAVVRHLVRLADAPMATKHEHFDLAGPERAMLADLIQRVAAAQGLTLNVTTVVLPGEAGEKVRAGVLQAPPGAIIDGCTFAEWLAASEA